MRFARFWMLKRDSQLVYLPTFDFYGHTENANRRDDPLRFALKHKEQVTVCQSGVLEQLGCLDLIMMDKTGTLTKSLRLVHSLDIAGQSFLILYHRNRSE